MTTVISSIVRTVTSKWRSVCVVSISSGFSGTGPFKGSSKCITHQFHYPWISVIVLLCLFLTGHSCLLYFSASFFVVPHFLLLQPFLKSFQGFPIISLISSSVCLHSFVCHCVPGLCLSILCSCLAVVEWCLLVLAFLNLAQDINLNPVFMIVLLAVQNILSCSSYWFSIPF